MVSSIDIQNKDFKKAAFGGYNIEDVNNFFEEVGESFKHITKENHDLKGKVEALVEEMKYYKTMEDTIQNVLVTAQKSANETKQEALDASETLTKEAKEQAKATKKDANEYANSVKQEADEYVKKAKDKVNEQVKKQQANAENDVKILKEEAQKYADKVKQDAEKHGLILTKEAQSTADELLYKVQVEVDLYNQQIINLKNQYDSYKKHIRKMLGEQLAILNQANQVDKELANLCKNIPEKPVVPLSQPSQQEPVQVNTVNEEKVQEEKPKEENLKEEEKVREEVEIKVENTKTDETPRPHEVETNTDEPKLGDIAIEKVSSDLDNQDYTREFLIM
ncbi:MAG: hypothetical protein ATN35_05070 [Epulopiscium sp. Nele67-Bin004]|nr:MAG: hypothetical protein ATN35_05070 [Epulopiscium sp. Nele67-Bin004]